MSVPSGRAWGSEPFAVYGAGVFLPDRRGKMGHMGIQRPSRPRVSIVIPAYAAAATLGGAVTGALTQTHPDIEVVVVDDGSPDDTAAVARAYGDRIRLVEKSNGGCASARNAGAAAATGEFLAFCDSDDELLPPAIETMLAAYHAAGAGRRAVTGNAYPLTSEGINPRRTTVMSEYPPAHRQRLEILQRNFASVFSLLPRSLFDEIGGFDDSLRVIEDWDLWMRLAHADVEIVYVKQPVALYRWSAGSMSSNSERMIEAENALLVRFEENHRDRLRPEEREYLARRLAAGSPWTLRGRADAALRTGNDAEAGRLYRSASALMPGDRRLRLRAASVGRVPAAARLWRSRDAKIQATVGRKGDS